MKRPLILTFGLALSSLAQEPPTPAGTPDALAVEAGDFINEVDTTVQHAATIYERASGKRAIVSEAMAQAKVSFSLGGPLTHAELAQFLQLTLLAEGVAVIPVPGEPKIVRFVPSGPNGSLELLHVTSRYTSEVDLPAEDEIVMFIMALQHLKPEEALEVMQAAFGRLTCSGTITALPNESSLIVTERVSLVRQMLKVRDAIDVAPDFGKTRASKCGTDTEPMR